MFESEKNERSTDYLVRSLGISTKTVGNDTQYVTAFPKEVSLGTYAEVKKQEMKHRSQQMLQQSS